MRSAGNRTRAPALSKRRGPRAYGTRYTISRQERRFVVSTPALNQGLGCEDRISVTGDHLSFDGNCGVRARPEMRPAAGDPTVSDPPFPLTFSSFVLPAGVGTPRDFMAPDTCDELLLTNFFVPTSSCLRRGPEPDVGLATWNN